VTEEHWRYKPGGPVISPHIRAQIERRRARFLAAWRRDPAREIALLLVFVVALSTLFVGAMSLKQYHFGQSGLADTAGYWMESAQRFRYVQRVADGGAIPRLDTRMEAPDGYPPWSDTVFQEWLYGTLYLEFAEPGTDTSAFVRLVTRIVSASAVVPIALLCLVLTRRRDAALLGAFAYATALVVAERGTGQALLREDLAVPLLCWHLVLLALWSMRPRFITALASGLVLGFALLTWKVLTFYALLLVAFVATAHWLRRARPGVLALGLVALLGPGALLSLQPYNLQYDQFLTSTPMLAAAALLLTLVAARFRPQVRPLYWLLPAVLLFALLRWQLPLERGYDHAWETIFARLRFLGAKPEDPSLLSFHARHYWTGNYQSPTLARLLRDWPALLLAAVPGIVLLLRWWRLSSWNRFASDERVPPPLPAGIAQGLGPSGHLTPLSSHFLLWLLLSFGGVYLLFRKLQLFAAIALVSVAALGFAGTTVQRRWIRGCVLIVLIGGLLQSTQVLPGADRLLAGQSEDSADPVVVFSSPSFDGLAKFLAAKTEEDETVMASFVISPFILTYGDRPTVLHCFFEGSLPERYRRITQARFGDEQGLWLLARELGVKWYVHEAHHLLRTDPQMSQRYVAGKMEWPADSVLTRMHFAPEQLKHFELRYENQWFRVFRVLDEDSKPQHLRSARPRPLWSSPLFASLFGDPLAAEGGVADKGGLVPADLLYATLQAGQLLAAGRASRQNESASAPWSERYFQESLRMAPYLYPAADELAGLYTELDRPEKAAQYRAMATQVRRFLGGRGEAPIDLRPVPGPGRIPGSFVFTGPGPSATPPIPTHPPP